MFQEYLNEVFEKFRTDDASERSYYPTLEKLLKIFPKESKKFLVLVESRNSSLGIPDFKVETNKELLVGYIEAKDLGRDLDKLTKTEEEQIDRYRKEYPKIIVTNYIEFRLYEEGELIESVIISQPITLKLKHPVLTNEGKIKGLLERFFSTTIPKIYTSKKLAELLARKTHVLRDLVVDEINLKDEENTPTEELFESFKSTLRPQMTEEEFADMYAQTVTFGLFTARVNSEGKEFNRIVAHEYIPKTIPLLRKLFWMISGQEVPQHVEWQVDEIAEILANTDIEKIKEQFFAEGKGRDPIIHFYETFLAEYDPEEREKRGVYYTPEPVVTYITNSIHELLKSKFGKEDGFADNSVMLLDPAGGTLTFPAKAISIAKNEYSKKYGEGGWSNFVREHILKNFYSFELLMAPYSIGHLKISLLLKELGYELDEDDRFKLYLTDTLDMEKVKPQSFLLAKEISEESEKAYEVKHKTPILVVLGNPPYSGTSENKGEWILKQIEEYKQIEGKSIGERNPKWIQDDYVKFFRFAQWKIEKEKQGILGFITNHAWLDNPTFRGMRYSLLKSFDEIYILNLHGSLLKKEETPEGESDENVFDIRPGVAISIFVKYPEQRQEKKVFYSDMWGSRESKYEKLETGSVSTAEWERIEPSDPYYFFLPKEGKGWDTYNNFRKITDIFPVNRSFGVVTSRDNFVIDFEKKPLEVRIRAFVDPNNNDEFLKSAYSLKESSNWKIAEAREELRKDKNWEDHLTKVNYRPFDERYIFYHPTVIERGREEVMQHMSRTNLALCVGRSGAVIGSKIWDIAFVSDSLVDLNLFRRGGEVVFPLYLYQNREPAQLSLTEQEKLDLPGTQHTLRTEGNKRLNVDHKIYGKMEYQYKQTPLAEDLFSYIYAVLYSNSYREKYKEFLKIDFPRIPFTKNHRLFQILSRSGKKLVDLHLMRSDDLNEPHAKFWGDGDGAVKLLDFIDGEEAAKYANVYIMYKHTAPGKKIKVKEVGMVKINDSQFFGPVPKEVWEYQIGGYQVLNKWLKDHKGRILSSEEIKTYCKIVAALSKTIEVQKEIDNFYPEVEKSLI